MVKVLHIAVHYFFVVWVVKYKNKETSNGLECESFEYSYLKERGKIYHDTFALLISTAAANIEHKAGYEDISSAFILPLWPHTCLTDIHFVISTNINEYQLKYYYQYLI